MDEVGIFLTSSANCACIKIRMWKYKMFSECSSSALYGGKATFCMWAGDEVMIGWPMRV